MSETGSDIVEVAAEKASWVEFTKAVADHHSACLARSDTSERYVSESTLKIYEMAQALSTSQAAKVHWIVAGHDQTGEVSKIVDLLHPAEDNVELLGMITDGFVPSIVPNVSFKVEKINNDGQMGPIYGIDLAYEPEPVEAVV